MRNTMRRHSARPRGVSSIMLAALNVVTHPTRESRRAAHSLERAWATRGFAAAPAPWWDFSSLR